MPKQLGNQPCKYAVFFYFSINEDERCINVVTEKEEERQMSRFKEPEGTA